MNRILYLLAALGLFAGVFLRPAPAQSEELWVSPSRAEEEWRTLRGAPIMTIQQGSPSSTVLLSTSDNTPSLNVVIPMTIPGNALIQSVTVCYQSSSPGTGINLIVLTEMTDPTFAYVKHNDPTFLDSTTPECYESSLLNGPIPKLPFRAQGTVTLKLSLEFADVSDTIEIGGIAIGYLPITVDTPEGAAPGQIALRQNFPNPFAGSTTIEYELPSAGPVELVIFDVAGRKIRTLEQGEKPAGSYRAVWDARDDNGERVAPGVYFYQARIGDRLGSKRMVLAQ